MAIPILQVGTLPSSTKEADSEQITPTGVELTTVPVTPAPASDLDVEVIGYGSGVLLQPDNVAQPSVPTERRAPMPRETYLDAIQSEINDGYVNKGYAVAQADQGNQGQGTLVYSFGIEPVVNVGRDYGPQYFETKPVSMDTTQRIGAPGFQTSEDAFAAAGALGNSRKASQPSPYAVMFGE